MPDDYVAPITSTTDGKRRRVALPAIVGTTALIAGMWVGAA